MVRIVLVLCALAALVASTSVGNDTGTRPAGSALWWGIVIGGTNVNNVPQPIQGEVNLVYHLDEDDLDVTFGNLYNLVTKARHPRIRRNNLSVSPTGTFGHSATLRGISGRFYGPGHAEVGACFKIRTRWAPLARSGCRRRANGRVLWEGLRHD